MANIMKVEVKKALFNYASKKIRFWAYFHFIKVFVFDERNTYNKYQATFMIQFLICPLDPPNQN